MSMWDCGGQEASSKMMTNYISGAHAALLVYNITSYESFANLEDWLGLVRRAFLGKSSQDMPKLFLVGNKSDLSYMRAVRSKSANAFADENSMTSFYMSAKSGDQVEVCFHSIVARLAGVEFDVERFNLSGGQGTVVVAQIVNHKRHDQSVNDGQQLTHRDIEKLKRSKSACAVS